MASLQTWIMASRPKTLPAAVAPVLIGSAMAYDDGGFSIAVAVACVMGALFIQIGTNFANDYFDFLHGTDTDQRTGPTRVTQAGLVSLRGMRWATLVAFLVAAAFGTFLVYRAGLPILVIGILSIIAGVLYTAGPYPLGYLGLGDILVLIFFGFAAVGGTYYAHTRTINTPVLIAGVGPGLLATAILVVNNLRDRETDVLTGKRTLAVRFGAAFAVVLVVLTRGHIYVLASIAPLLLSIPTIRTVFQTDGGPALNAGLAETGRVLLFFSLTFAIGWVI